MLKKILFILLLIVTLILGALEWSEPVNITNANGYVSDNEFCVDTNGVIHCVWFYEIEPNYKKIFYSKSEDEGETWSEPICISQNNELWMARPKIVSDSQNNLYVAYLHNVAGTNDTPRIYFTKFDGTSWCQPYCISEQYGGVGMSDVVIDNNDRVYVFWHWGGSEGEIYYRYLEDGEWSEVIAPYENNTDQYCLVEAVCDSNNNLHCIIDHHPEETGSRASYIKYDYTTDTWEEPIILAERRCQQGKDIALDSNDNPHLVWREYTNDLIPPNDGTFYSYIAEDSFTEPELLVEDPFNQIIVIDNNNKYIIEREKRENGWQLVYYYSQNGSWEGHILISDTYCPNLPRSIIYHNNLFLIFENFIDYDDSDIYFMKADLETNAIDENTIESLSYIDLSQNYPNPFNPTTKINFALKKGGETSLKIFNVKGQLVKQLIDEYKQPGQYSILWNGTNNENQQIASGCYYYRLQVNDRIKTKTLTLIK